MRTMLLSFKAEVYKKIVSGEKIFEHRNIFPSEPVKAYLYVSSPISSITGILYLGKKHSIVEWKKQFSYDLAAIQRIDAYLAKHRYAMEIDKFIETSVIPLSKLRQDIDKFVVPQMYYYLEGSNLLSYLEENLKPTGLVIEHRFDDFVADDVCKN